MAAEFPPVVLLFYQALIDGSVLTQMTVTGLEPKTTQFVNEHSTIQPNWPSLAKWLGVRL